MTIRARVLTIALLAGIVAVSSALAGSRAARHFTVTSTLDGKGALPPRSPWIPNPRAADRRGRLLHRRVPCLDRPSVAWYYGGLANSLIATFLKPGIHKFVVRAVEPSGEHATDTVLASVLHAPPRKLAGTRKRKLFTLTISKVGWATRPNNNVGVQYLAHGRVLIGPDVMDRPEQTATFCDLVDSPHRWAVVVTPNDRSLTLIPVRPISVRLAPRSCAACGRECTEPTEIERRSR